MLEELRELEEKGYVRSVLHRELPLAIFNYTQKTQFEKVFGDYPILRRCRGLVLSTITGKPVNFPLLKFFNWEELQPSERPNPGDKIEIGEKLDGSLILIFRYEDQVIYTTRGSFYSDQALIAPKVFRDIGYDENWIEVGKTYCLEYVSPANRIVVHYPNSDLIHIALLDSTTGEDLPRDERFHCVPIYDINNSLYGEELYEIFKSFDLDNKEGFVVRRLSNDSCQDFRMKVKGDLYIQLHKIVTGISNKSIWECLRDGKNFDDILEIVPDEFSRWLLKTKKSLEEDFRAISERAQIVFERVKLLTTRKEQALEILENDKDISSVVFGMLNDMDWAQIVWKMVKPEKFVQPFVNGEE